MGIDDFTPATYYSDVEIDRLRTPQQFRQFMNRRIRGMNFTKWKVLLMRAREVREMDICPVMRQLMGTVIEDIEDVRDLELQWER